MKKIDIEIASVPLRFSGEDSGFMQELKEIYAPFLAAQNAPVVEIELVPFDGESFPGPDTGHRIKIRHQADRLSFSNGAVFQGWLDLSEKRGAVRLVPEKKSFDMVLRILYSRLLPEFNGMLMHGAAVESGNRGFLFFGPSESGKTTISRVSARSQKQVLNDELCVVRELDGLGFCVYGTPFWGEFKGPSFSGGYSLAACLEIIKSRRIQVRFSRHDIATLSLMKNILNFCTDVQSSRKFLEIASCCALHVKNGTLEWGRDHDLWRHLEDIRWN